MMNNAKLNFKMENMIDIAKYHKKKFVQFTVIKSDNREKIAIVC